jgi:hypothetical protein
VRLKVRCGEVTMEIPLQFLIAFELMFKNNFPPVGFFNDFGVGEKLEKNYIFN